MNNASTFPGFCEKHEQLFFEFESTGSLSSIRHIALQAFRTLCREIARKRHAVDQLEKRLKEYREARTRQYSAAIKRFDQKAKISAVKVKGDGLEQLTLSRLKGQRADLAELEGDLYDELFVYIDSQKQDPALQALSFPFEVPVSLSGFGVLTYQSGSKKHRALCPLGILPLAGETVVFIGAARKHAAVVEAYRAAMEHGFNGLNAMEPWLTNGSDHWFIRPSAWAAFRHTDRKSCMGAGLELFAAHKDGHEFPVEISLSPLQTQDGLLVTSAIRDITERKRTEASLRLLSGRFLQMQNEERRRIARELHDSAGQILAALNMNLTP